MPIARSGELLYAVVLPAVSILACIATGGGFVVAIPRIVSRMVRMLIHLNSLRFSSARLGITDMSGVLDPFRFVLIAVAGHINERQLQVIDYLREENRVLREQLGGRRLRLNDDQRRRLAAKAKV